MRRLFLTILLLIPAVCFLSLGCSGESAPAPNAAPSEDESSVSQAEPEVQQALAQLSAEDRELAEKQQICPVSGEPLGSMGKPVKVSVQGRDVLVCCEGCVEKLQDNPDEYLAKLEAE